MYTSTWHRIPKTETVILIIEVGGQELATFKSNQMRSVKYSSHMTTLLLSFPLLKLCVAVFREEITSTSAILRLQAGHFFVGDAALRVLGYFSGIFGLY